MLRVHIKGNYTEDGLRHLRTKVNDKIQITAGKDIPEPADYAILVDGFADRSWVEASPDLQAVIVPCAGVPEPTCKLLRDYPAITLHNLHYYLHLMQEVRESIEQYRFEAFKKDFYNKRKS